MGQELHEVGLRLHAGSNAQKTSSGCKSSMAGAVDMQSDSDRGNGVGQERSSNGRNKPIARSFEGGTISNTSLVSPWVTGPRAAHADLV